MAKLWVGLERLSVVAVLAAAAAVLSAAWGERGPETSTLELPRQVLLDGAPSEGATDAPVSMVIFADFECAYCARLARETVPALRETYVRANRLRIAFRHLPLETIHPTSMELARAAACAQREGQFWPVHDVLFARWAKPPAARWGELRLVEALEAEGVNFAAVTSCMADPSTDGPIRRDMQIAAELGFRSTPQILIGRTQSPQTLTATHHLRGARPIEEFIAAIEDVERSTTFSETGKQGGLQ